MGSQLSPKRGTAPQFSVHVYCGQTAGWMKTPLGTEVDVGPGHIVLDGVPALRERGTAAGSPSNTMSHWPSPASVVRIPSGKLIHPTVRPRDTGRKVGGCYINVTRQTETHTDNNGRIASVAQKIKVKVSDEGPAHTKR